MEPLTEAQRAALRGALEGLDRDLGSSHAATAEGAAPVALDQPIGRVSRVDAIQQQRMVQANRASLQRRHEQVRAALRRFDNDEYGECVACGEEVGFPRLEAQPEAPLCIQCQSKREQRG